MANPDRSIGNTTSCPYNDPLAKNRFDPELTSRVVGAFGCVYMFIAVNP
jgi:hypothetical protein